DGGGDGKKPLCVEGFPRWARLGAEGSRPTGGGSGCGSGGVSRRCFLGGGGGVAGVYTLLCFGVKRGIFGVAGVAVVWSRPPNSFPIFGSDESVSSRARYMATCRG